MQRVDLVARFPGGEESAPFAYDIAVRAALDAVIVAAHFVEDGERHVFLRSAVRPPLALRSAPPPHDGLLWELPAGLVEPGESPRSAAARELHEELGFEVEPRSLLDLGPWTFPAPGFIAETHHFFHLDVGTGTRGAPLEDGSALEREAAIIAVPLAKALEHCRRGHLRDAKTELALRRLAEGFG